MYLFPINLYCVTAYLNIFQNINKFTYFVPMANPNFRNNPPFKAHHHRVKKIAGFKLYSLGDENTIAPFQILLFRCLPTARGAYRSFVLDNTYTKFPCFLEFIRVYKYIFN